MKYLRAHDYLLTALGHDTSVLEAKTLDASADNN